MNDEFVTTQAGDWLEGEVLKAAAKVEEAETALRHAKAEVENCERYLEFAKTQLAVRSLVWETCMEAPV